MLPPWSPYLAIIWAPEKYRWPWLTELFFRFEPVLLFDSDPAGEGKRFPKVPPRVLGAGKRCPVALSPLDLLMAPVAVPAAPKPYLRSRWRSEPESVPLVIEYWAEAPLIQHVLKPPK